MRAFVTGASGFLGGRLAELLVEQGFEVTALVRTTADVRHLSHLPIRLVRGDLASKHMLKDLVRDVSYIYHCAACSTDWASWQTYYEANVLGQRICWLLRGQRKISCASSMPARPMHGITLIARCGRMASN